MATITLPGIVSEYGAYYEKSGQNKKRLIQKLLYGFESYKYMTPIKTDETIYKMAVSLLTRVLQGFKTTYSPTDGVKFDANPITLFKNKIDQSYYPDELEDTWLGFLAGNQTNRKEWPFIKWLIEVHIIPQANKDLEDAIFNAEYVAPTAGNATPGALLEIMNGLKKQIVDGKSSLNRITLATLTTSNIFDQVEIFRKDISLVYRRTEMKYFMAPSWADAYMLDKRNTFSSLQLGDYSKVDFSPHQVVGLPSMEGSDIIFATPKSNMLYITKKAANMTKFSVEENRRLVDIFSDFWQGVGFGTLGAVFASIPDTEDGSASGA